MKLKTLILVLLASFAVLAAGCGGVTTSGSGPGGATLVRSDLLAFVSVDSDLGSSQWKKVDALSNKFPGRDDLLAKLKQSLAKDGVDYNHDVKPALGPEVDLAVAAGSTLDDTAFAALTKPDDAGKFKELIKKLDASDSSGKPSVYREVYGWYFVSDSQDHITRVLKGGVKALSEDANYHDALAKLPSDALAKAYVNGAQLAKIVHKLEEGKGSSLAGSNAGLDKLDFISASLTAENDGLRLHGVADGSGASQLAGSGDYTSKLIDQVPADALAFLTFRPGEALRSGLQSVSGPLEYTLGISVDDLANLFANESALYVRPSAVIPEITLLLQPKDTSSAMATLDKLARRIARATGGSVKGGSEKTIDFGSFAVHFGTKDGKVVVTSSPGGVAQVGTSGDNLTDGADFKEAKAAAGLPDANGGFVYIDLKNAIPLIEGFAGLAGSNLPSTVTENLQPLRSFLAWSAGSGNARTFDLFLEIK